MFEGWSLVPITTATRIAAAIRQVIPTMQNTIGPRFFTRGTVFIVPQTGQASRRPARCDGLSSPALHFRQAYLSIAIPFPSHPQLPVYWNW